MTRYEDQCVGCPPEIGCLGAVCPNKNVKIYECDNCHDIFYVLYDYNGEQLCADCVLEKLDIVE